MQNQQLVFDTKPLYSLFKYITFLIVRVYQERQVYQDFLDLVEKR